MGAVLGSALGGGIFVVFVIFYVVGCLPLMGIFGKAKQPAWAAFVPVYNFLVLLKLVGRPWYWLLLCLIPFAGIVFEIIILYDLSKSFGKGGGFTVGLVFLGWIFLMILWLGQAQYRGPGAKLVSAAPPGGYGGYAPPPGGYAPPPGGYAPPPGGYAPPPPSTGQSPPPAQPPPPG